MVFKNFHQMFCWISFNQNLSDVFLMIRLGLWGSRRKTTEMKCRPRHIISGDVLSTWVTTVDVNFDHLAQVVFVRLLRCKLIFFSSFPHHILWKEITVCGSHLRNGEPCSTSHLFIHSFINTNLDSWVFILYIGFIIQYYLTYIVAQIVPTLAIGNSFRFVPVPLWYDPIIWGFLALPYLLRLKDAPGPSCIIPAPALESAIFPRSLTFFRVDFNLFLAGIDNLEPSTLEIN